MGVWAGGPSATSIDPAGIAEAMRPALYEWFTGHIIIFDPNRAQVSKYNPDDDAGGRSVETIILDSGENGALVQPIRSPTRIEMADQPNGILGVRFQVKREVLTKVEGLRGGLQVRVVNGGNSPELVGPIYSLQEPFDSSLAWGRIFDAVVLTGG